MIVAKARRIATLQKFRQYVPHHFSIGSGLIRKPEPAMPQPMVRLLVTYMEMTDPPAVAEFPAPAAGVAVAKECLSSDEYLALYRAVGGPLQWDQRLRMKAADLKIFLRGPSTALHILRHQGKAVGLCEFSGVCRSNVELTHFGLVPQAQGRRFGPFLLDSALRSVWSSAPTRIWLHTDTYDHPKAQSTYGRAGFKAYLERFEDFPD